MARFSWPLGMTAGVLAALAGCSGFDFRERPAWRTQAEKACLAQNLVQVSAFIQPAREINGPGICGLHYPFKVRALANGTVSLRTAETLDCSMIPALDAWITSVLQPAAIARFGEPVAEIRTMGSYNCRGINNMSGAGLSEHAFGNAIDISGFVLRSGRELNVMRGWKSPNAQDYAFLHEAHAGACSAFTTVLGPGSNAFHYNHFHLDLALHGSTSRGLRRVCKPAPEQSLPEAPKHDTLPDPPAIEEEMDLAAAPVRQPGAADGPGLRAFVATAVPAAAPFSHPRREDALSAADRAGLADLAAGSSPMGVRAAPSESDESEMFDAPQAPPE